MRLAIAALVFFSSAARAQDERAIWAALSQQNQAGLLEYCSRQGYIPDVVRTPTMGTPTPGGPAASAAGREGVIRYVDPQVTLAEDAAASGTTVAYRCLMMSLQPR